MPELSEIPGLLPHDGDPNTRRRGRLPDQMIPTDVLACFACGWWVTAARVGGILSPRNTCPNCAAHGGKPTKLAPATLTVTRQEDPR